MTRQILPSFAVALIATALVQGQTKSDPNPRQGLQPAGVYALSEIETLNQTNGNLSLRIPLGSLGPDRAGASHGIALVYNSKIWEGAITNTPVSGQEVPVYALGSQSRGGWRYEIGYDLELSFREGLDSSDCSATNAELLRFDKKLRVVFPDGSKHLLRQAGRSDYGGDGFYEFGPDGWSSSSCSSTASQLTTNPIVYYTTDGTYARLEVFHSTAATPQLTKTSWTLYFANGDSVKGGNDWPTLEPRPQALCDRNQNCVYLDYVFRDGSPAFSEAYFTTVRDDFGRSITITHGSSGSQYQGGPDTVSVPGYGGTPLSWSVNWSWIADASPAPEYYCQPVGSGGGSPTCVKGGSGYMVTGIIPPVQSDLHDHPYVFEYNARWGEMSSVTLPSAAKATYTYRLDSNAAAAGCSDTVTGFPYWYDVLANYPCAKTVQWTGTGSANENSHFVINRTVGATYTTYESSIYTDPSGGQTTTRFYPYSYNAGSYAGNWQSGLVWEIDRPDGSVVTRAWAQNPLYNVSLPYESQNAYLQSETRSLTGPSGTVSAQTTYTVDRNGNPLVTTEKDWLVGSNQPVLRKTTLTYKNSTEDASSAPTQNEASVYWNPIGVKVLSLPASKKVEGPTTDPAYEEYCLDAAGNMTVRARQLSGATGGTLVNCSTGVVASNAIGSKWAYGVGGIVKVATDGRGISTQFTYDANNLYVTEKAEACNQSLVADPTCTLAEARKTGYATEFYSGKVTTVKDIDNSASQIVQTTTVYDVFARPTSVTDAAGVTTTIAYQDTNPQYQLTTAALDGTRSLKSAKCFDPMGRPSMNQSSENGSLTSLCTDTEGIRSVSQYAYAASGRYEWTSNPHRGTGEATMGWARRYYDNAGRLVEEATFSGDASPGQTSNNLTGKKTISYDGACRTIRDQAANAVDAQNPALPKNAANPGSVRKICTDAAGRVASVTESMATDDQVTTYAYL